jgi:hypothetical protein
MFWEDQVQPLVLLKFGDVALFPWEKGCTKDGKKSRLFEACKASIFDIVKHTARAMPLNLTLDCLSALETKGSGFRFTAADVDGEKVRVKFMPMLDYAPTKYLFAQAQEVMAKDSKKRLLQLCIHRCDRILATHSAFTRAEDLKQQCNALLCGKTPLIQSIEVLEYPREYKDFAHTLEQRQKEIDFNQASEDGETATQAAARVNKPRILELLLDTYKTHHKVVRVYMHCPQCTHCQHS